MQPESETTPGFKVGERVDIPIAYRRRWWQFWLPKFIGGKYVIVSVSPENSYEVCREI